VFIAAKICFTAFIVTNIQLAFLKNYICKEK
jgi:hypothetical protein